MTDERTIKTVTEVLEHPGYEGIVKGRPTGMYADRASYGNAPMIAFVLGRKLACKVRARPYSHKTDKLQVQKPSELEKLTGVVFSYTPDNENEMLGVAAAFIDQSIREGSNIEVHGNYQDNEFHVQFLKINGVGFGFPGYQFAFERQDEK